MKKDFLIPIEKSKRVIFLELRGRRNKKIMAWCVGLKILGSLCLLYCLSILLFMGYGSSFFLIWGILAVGCLGLAWFLSHEKWLQRLPKWLKRGFVIGAAVAVVFFGIVEGMILSQCGAEAEPGADYMIVLGAQWKEDGPSYVLKKRLDKALQYLNENPRTQVIVSGGQGSNEPISEAQGMYEYLVAAGIEAERIFLENQSENTYENLVFSSEFLETSNQRVVVVTNDFHMLRAMAIAKKQGYGRIEGLAADSYPGMLPNNLLREFFGIVKDFWVGNL